jgi:hypothetical protein
VNKTQLDYAFRRIDKILSHKETECASRHTKPAQYIDDDQRADLVRAGKVKLKTGVDRISHYDKVVSVFDFSKFAWDATIDQKAVDREMKALRKEAEGLKDRIMLGDESTAMAALEVFAKKCGAE